MVQFNPKSIVNSIISQFIVLGSIIGAPIFLFIAFLFYFYKIFVTILAKVSGNNLQKRLNNFSTILADENIYENPGNFSIVTVLRIEGNLTLPQVTQVFNDNVICAKYSNKKRYPELQQFPVNFMGYYFWKQDVHFSISNHIEEHDDLALMPVSKIHQYMLNENFVRNRSPWKLKIFRNSNQNRKFLALKIHHSMADARSIVKLFVECLGNKTLVSKEARFKSQSISENLKYLIELPIGMIRYCAKLIQFEFNIFWHPWKRQYPGDKSPLMVGISGRVPMSKLKDTSRVLGVRTSAVILSAITSAIEKVMKSKNQCLENLQMFVVLPKEGHSQTFDNYMSFGVSVIAGEKEIEDVTQIVRRCNEIYNGLRGSDDIGYFEIMSGAVAALPGMVRRVYSKTKLSIISFSNIAGEEEGFMVGDLPCLGFSMSAGLVPGTNGVSFTAISYKESFQVGVVAKGSILDDREAITLARQVEKELLGLCQLVLG